MMVLDNNLYFAPIDNPERVLDIGTGTGLWAIDFADTHPSSHVVGNDLSPIQPGYAPPNLEFVVDDIEDEWTYRSKPFDFIHARYLAGAIRNWPRLVSQAYACTKPGGWVEFQDYDMRNFTQDNSIGPGNKVAQLMDLLIEACDKMGRTANPGIHLREWIEQAGFENVKEEVFNIPLGAWPKDKKMVRSCRFLFPVEHPPHAWSRRRRRLYTWRLMVRSFNRKR